MTPYESIRSPLRLRKPPPHTERGMQIGLIALVSMGYLCAITVADPDLWGHTLYGLRALDRGVLAERADPFSYTAGGSPWINHEWLTELSYGWLWRTCGSSGLWWWRAGMALGVFAVAAWSAQRARASVASLLLLWIFSAQSLAGFLMFVRPQLATLVLFGATLAILRSHWDSPHSRGVWLLPLATALWANLHGGFLAGLGLQAVFLAAWGGARRKPARNCALIQLGAVWGLSCAGSLVNPYGWHLHMMLWQHLVPEQAVREWQPLWNGPQSPACYTPFLLPLIALVFSRRWQWIDLLVLLVVGLQSLLHLRHVALLATANLVLLPGPLSDALQRRFSAIHRSLTPPGRHARRWFAVVAALALMIGIHVPALQAFWRHGLRPWQIAVETSREAPGVPWRAVTWMRQHHLSGNLVTDYAWGQYAIWHLHPEVRVAFDGRYRTVYPERLERDYLAFARGDSAGDAGSAILDGYPTEMALLPVRSPSRAVLDKKSEWVVVFADRQACLYVRRLAKFQRLMDWGSSESVPSVPTAVWMPFPGGPVRDPGLASKGANGSIRQARSVCNGYRSPTNPKVPSGGAGFSDKYRNDRVMRPDAPRTTTCPNGC